MINFSGLKGTEIRIPKIFEEIPIGIISFGADGTIDFVNSAFSRMGLIYRLKIPTLLGTNIFEKEIIPGISLTNELEDLKKGYAFEKEIKNLKIIDGSEISVIIKCTPLCDEEKFAGGILVLEDLKTISEAREEEHIKILSFQKVTNTIADLFFIIDVNGQIKYAAGNKLNLVSYYDSKNHNIKELIPGLPDDFNDLISGALTKGEEKRILKELEINHEIIFYECLITPLSLKQQSSKFLALTFNNISDKIKSEVLEKRLNLYKNVSDILSDGLVGIDSQGIITSWSPSVNSLTGFTEEETSGRAIWDFIPSLKDYNSFKENIEQINFFKKEINILNKGGKEINAEASFILGDSDNILISLSTTSVNKQYDFKVLEENFRNLVTKADEIILHINEYGIIEYTNPAFTQHLNFNIDEVTGKSLNEFIPPGSNLIFEPVIEKPFNREIPFINKKGVEKSFFANLTPDYRDNVLYGYNLYLINFSEIKKQHKDLILFQSLFENTSEGIAIESKGRIISANNAFAKLFGYSSANELEGKDILEVAASNDILKVAEYLQHYRLHKPTSPGFEFSGKRKDGTVFPAELNLSTFETDGEKYSAIFVRNITQRKRAQQVIIESEEKYRNLIENIDDFLFILDKSKFFFKPVFFTNSVKKITGYIPSEMINDIKLLFRLIHPDDLINFNEELKKIIKNKGKSSFELEFRIINKQGNIVWVKNKLSVIRNEKGEAEKIYGLVSDITFSKKTEEDLQRSTKNLVKLNETKDRFISIISHDLRTPFSSILGFTDLMLNDETLTGEERNQYVKYIQESSNSMLSLVNSLLDWTRLQTGRIRFEPERVDAYGIIIKSINSLKGVALQKNITLSSDINENTYVFVDEELIGQVFNNLISNAIKFTKEGGSINISLSSYSSPRFYEFSIKDTGVGITPVDAKKLFGIDYKFSTEGTAGEKGTGLGLSLVKEIIEKHNGTIRVESEPGSGSDFIFTLPVAAANILLVDSNTTDRILYSKILKHITPDYEVESASTGKEALDKIMSSTYALVVTEHKMPVMGGYEFVLELKKSGIKMKPPVIILSSYIDWQTIDDYNEIGITEVFQKPVNLSIFKQSVEKSLTKALKN